ncbi:pimeloyl-ACP methyl ester carboxylesterase [Asanoa ferruginea]|uniref:Pimeloyl-ACP methyl ester carboxylesterase n=1 Tax=Asanoa ferruginea TaxID=53367 RepID=A0A3D9ZNN6_9ACTN|nr:alpha/beta hydrolase [Asanoa ferruginea]REF98865.1 pimeloyl-ACP methyl ester carboxylesterase [Asanoa ferruginea]GIF46454.1 alpha/beta hydrolase [Asanoa ferruginea]
MAPYLETENKTTTAADGVTYAYRETGQGGLPLVLLQHYRGNLDFWDPALIDALSAGRRVIMFDYAGVGASTGRTADTIDQMARETVAFVTSLGLDRIDVLGFSIGSFVAQRVALDRPSLIRRLVLASTAPEGAEGMFGWAPEVIGAVGAPEMRPENYLSVFFAPSETSQAAGQQTLERIYTREAGRDEVTTWDTRLAQYDAVVRWGTPNHAALQRLSAIDVPVFVANGDSDPMMLPRYSHLVAGLLPNADIKIYPDAAHGFLFQHFREFADDLTEFLTPSDEDGRVIAATNRR